MIDVLSFGAGVQSTTLLLMSCEGILPRLDAAIFADTQWEPQEVYAHLEWCKDMAARAGIPILVDTAGNLRADLLDFWHHRRSADGKRHASIPAFVRNPDGSRGIVRRQCTSAYKIEVVERVLRRDILMLQARQHWPKAATIRQWIGISADEFHRRRRSDRPCIELYYPLLDSLTIRETSSLFERGYTRDDCLAWLKDRGFPRPPRSACIGCPFHSDAEWSAMKQHRPADFADAVEVDRLIREFDKKRLGERGQLAGEVFLHSSLIPLDLVALDASTDASEGRGMANDCTGMCGL